MLEYCPDAICLLAILSRVLRLETIEKIENGAHTGAFRH
jgi:hypothetical protein